MDTATTEIYTLSLHDALPISVPSPLLVATAQRDLAGLLHRAGDGAAATAMARRSEEHTSELQSPYELVCRHLPEKKKHTDDEERARNAPNENDTNNP